jgi:hypothetical protein
MSNRRGIVLSSTPIFLKRDTELTLTPISIVGIISVSLVKH